MAEPIKTDIDKAPDWWRAWFEDDYSWEGLAKKPWDGWVVVDGARCVPKDEAPEDAETRDATLQDYWRADPENDWALRDDAAMAEEWITGEASPDGQTWHIAHVPPGPKPGESVDADRQAGWFKANVSAKGRKPNAALWKRLNACLTARLAAAEETEVDWQGDAEGPDRRAQLDGVVLAARPTLPDGEATPLHLSLRRSAHLLGANYRDVEFGPGARFQNARFAGFADFQSASFAGDAVFQSASFAGYAVFHSASFARDADFDSASFAGFAYFQSASFAGDAIFQSASFAGYAVFQSASFAGYAVFQSASFAGGAYFNSASFLRDADFRRGSAPALESGRLVRGGGMRNATALRDAEPKLGQDDFALILSNGAARRETGAFSTFDFERGLALGEMAFHDRVFGQQPDFSHARFFGPLQFFQAELHDGVLWHGAQFEYQSDQDGLSWRQLVERLSGKPGYGPKPDGIGEWAWIDESLQEKRAEREIEDPIRRTFWTAAWTAWRAYTERSRAGRRAARPVWMEYAPRGRPDSPENADIPNAPHVPDKAQVKANASADAKHFEQAYRRLKLLMRQQGSHLDEQKFFELELRARQARDPGRDKDVRRWEIWGAAVYGAFAEYGSSITRPLLLLAVVWGVASIGYLSLAAGANVLPASTPSDQFVARSFGPDDAPSWGQRWDGLKRAVTPYAGPGVFAAEITLAPVANPIRHHAWAEDLQEAGDGWSAAFSALRLLHRVFAIPLLFLFALALRRRFQLG